VNNSASGQAPLLPVLLGAAVLASAFQAPQGAAQVKDSSVTPSQDCLEWVLQASDDPTLTRAERIAALDKALLESLSRTTLCGAGATGVGAGAAIDGGAAGGVAGTGGAGDSSGDATGGVESLPAAGVQGDLPDAVETAVVNPSPEATAKTDPNGGANQTGGAPANVPGVDAPSGNGKVPDDIPPAANDDIIAQQLRQAATDEADPATRAKLWNEYRRYQNLPVKKVPESADAGAN